MKKGFTLAEVLLTLGIIGVVSALTIPTFVRNHQKQVFVTQLKKVYSELAQAADSALVENNAISLNETKFNGNNSNATKEFFNSYLKIVKTCTDDKTPCFAESYKYIDGTEFEVYLETDDERPCFVLADGASICTYIEGWEEFDPSDNVYNPKVLCIDVNGAQGPNIVGRDLFHLEIYPDGKVGESYNNDSSELCQETGVTYGAGCLSKIINDGWKMDY